MVIEVSMQAVSISVSWAIAQYRQVLATMAARTGAARNVKTPADPPEVLQYFRQIGIGRHIDAYA